MHNLNDNELDSLFQEGAEYHEFEYNANSWKLMEDKLDGRKRRLLFFRITGVLLLLGMVGFAAYYTTNIKSEVARNASNSVKEANVVTSEIQSNIEKTYGEKVRQEEVSNHLTINQNEKIHTEENIDQNHSNEHDQAVTSNIFAPSEPTIEPHLLVEQVANRSLDYTHITTQLESSDIYISNDSEAENRYGNNLGRNVIYQSRLPIFDSFVNSQNVTQRYVDPQYTEAISLVTQSPLKYSITLFANPEWSSVGLFSQLERGWKVGAKFGVQVTNHLQLGLGLGVSKKIYGAVGENYVPANGWIDDIKPMWMNAKCTVLEIPLELGYYHNGYNQNGFFATAGISSYILNSEWYGFRYDESKIDPVTLENLVKEINPEDIEGKHHVVGVGRVSFGYHQRISRKAAFEISPYIEIPLTGIGEGSVNLYSTGIKMALRFNN